MGKITRRHVSLESWHPDQIRNMLQHITLGIKTKMLRGQLVASFDASLSIQQHHPTWRSLHRGQKFIKTSLTLLILLVTIF